jgi:L-ascorbate metabolism protein UlaG (beta-lactamase superfamily)
MIECEDVSVSWLGYATIRIEGAGAVVYLDPGRYGVLEWYDGGDGDVVCVSHDHHYDSDGIRTVAESDADLVVFEGLNTHRIDRPVERPADLPFDVRTVDTAADIAAGEAIVRTTAAYNEPGGPRVRENGEPYHPEGFGCGFHVTLGGTSVYYPGDTDVLEGHDRLDVDVFCPPIGGTFTMDRHEAADLAAALDPAAVVPVHYGTFEAIEADAEAFAADLSDRGVRVELDE